MNPSPSPPRSARTGSHGSSNNPNDQEDGEPGVRIGPYQGCHYVASGVTAEVYRSKDRALKVITETRTLEPHNPFREAKILDLLNLLKKPCIPLLETFRDHEQRFVLVFPYMPLTLGDLLEQGPLDDNQIRTIFTDVFSALASIHGQGIIHRDIKPSAVLLASPTGPAYLSDFGTAWHPILSASSEPANQKILDIGTGPYRAPEVLFGNKSYDTGVDMWGAGAMLAECCRNPPKPLFESRQVHEDGNQLGLILSIFKTMGSPTRESWPEAATFKTPPFEMYRSFEPRAWEEILPDVKPEWRRLVAETVRYDSGRATAEQVLLCLSDHA
jgi:cyclin-dependent kinase